jgi:hypothetical protein
MPIGSKRLGHAVNLVRTEQVMCPRLDKTQRQGADKSTAEQACSA